MQASTLHSSQRGGTFLGLLLGVMIGLGVALGVAIYVAKVPVPFVNKNTSRTTGQDAAEAERNRDWDPNAPLRQRNGARPPATGGAVVPAPAPAPIRPDEAGTRPTPPAMPLPAPAEVRPAPPRTAEKPPEPTQAQQTTPRDPRVSDDPLGDFAAARARGASTAPAGPAASADPFTYFVQAGAFRAQADAEAQRARPSLMGVQARVSEREQAGRTVYRVRVGPFQNKDAADRVKERLDSNGFDSALVRVQR